MTPTLRLAARRPARRRPCVGALTRRAARAPQRAEDSRVGQRQRSSRRRQPARGGGHDHRGERLRRRPADLPGRRDDVQDREQGRDRGQRDRAARAASGSSARRRTCPPGFSGDVRVERRPPAQYTLYCPGATPERTTLKVTGTAPARGRRDVAALLRQGTAGYAHVRQHPGRRAGGRGRHARHRAQGHRPGRGADGLHRAPAPYYERIEPVAESFVIGKDSTSTPTSTPARATSRPRSGAASTASRRACSSRRRWPAWRAFGDEAGRRRRPAAEADRGPDLPAGRAGQRRAGPARRGRRQQDHRRGGALLPHRPARLRRQRRGRRAGVRAAAAGAGQDRPGAGARRSAPTFTALDTLRRQVPDRPPTRRATSSTPQLTDGRQDGFAGRGQGRAGAAVEGRRARSSNADDRATTATPSRRRAARFLGGALGAAGVVAAGGAGFGVARATEPERARRGRRATSSPFYGHHQAGIATPAQDRLAFAAFDVTAHRRRSRRRSCSAPGRRPPRR